MSDNIINEKPISEQEKDPIEVCAKCRYILQEDFCYCPKCGANIYKTIESKNDTKADISYMEKFQQLPMKRKKELKTAAWIGIVSIAIIIIFAINVFNSDVNFSEKFSYYASRYSDSNWIEFSDDNSYMKIDTNPLDLKDKTEYNATFAIESINKELGFSESLYEKMKDTTALDGRQTEENRKIKVSWTYHPDKGLEVMYENK